MIRKGLERRGPKDLQGEQHAGQRAVTGGQGRDRARSGRGLEAELALIAVLCPGTSACFKRETRRLSNASFNYSFVFQGSTVAREASDKEKVSTLTCSCPAGALGQRPSFFLTSAAAIPPVSPSLPQREAHY